MIKPYDALLGAFKRIDRFSHLSSIASWDQAAMMPAGGSQARSEALAEIGALCHSLLTDPSMERLLSEAEQSDLTAEQRASAREMRREWLHASLLPEDLVVAKSLAGSACEHAWRAQRPANDWKGFLANFEPVVEHSRREAQLLSESLGLSRYDALMDKFEPGFGSARAEKLFDQTMQWLPSLISQARSNQASWSPIALQGPFDISAQRELGLDVMGMLGFDFDRGRLDVSAHPFCGGVPQDVRITTVYHQDDCASALMGIVHETGHALYEQNLPLSLAGLPAGRARSMAVHESQSLFHEMQLGAHPGFLSRIAPMMERRFGSQAGFEPSNLAMLAMKVEPGLIRIQADELTYPAHIALRFDIERKLIEGTIEARDIPALWDERMEALLGIDTRGNYKDGPMQDIHWTDGSFGYFPSYTLGAMLAAQLFSAIRRDLPHVDASIGQGDFTGIHGWLRDKIWSKASLLSTPELIMQATGAELGTDAFRTHLESRYSSKPSPKLGKPR
jgi:carboxypeptidase Taq